MIPIPRGGENAAQSSRMNAIIWTLLDSCPHCTSKICKDIPACLAEAQSQKLCGHIAGYVQACLQIWPKGEAGGSPRQTPTAPTLKAAVWCSWGDHAFPKSHICQGTFEIVKNRGTAIEWEIEILEWRGFLTILSQISFLMCHHHPPGRSSLQQIFIPIRVEKGIVSFSVMLKRG